MIWERQRGETARAFAAFCAYRDLGRSRTLVEAARAFYESPNVGRTSAKVRQVERWSSAHGWVRRVDAYDEEMGRERRLRREQAIYDLEERHARIAQSFQSKVIQRLQTLRVEELSPTDLARWFDVAARIERQALGQATSITEHRVSPVERLMRLLSGQALDQVLSADPGGVIELLDEYAAADPRVREALDLVRSPAA